MIADNTYRIGQVKLSNPHRIADMGYSLRMANDTPTPEDRARGKRLKEAREAHHETAADAARALKIGVSTYRSHENGYRAPWASLQRYAAAYGYSVEWIAYGTGPKKPSGADRATELAKALRGDFLDLAIQNMLVLKKQQDRTEE